MINMNYLGMGSELEMLIIIDFIYKAAAETYETHMAKIYSVYQHYDVIKH